MRKRVALLACCLLQTAVWAEVSYQLGAFNNWSWGDMYVVDNGVLKAVIAPDYGGRVVHYGTRNKTFLYIKGSTTSYIPGSYETNGSTSWPVPQDNWGWPPPPTIANGNYTDHVLADAPESLVVEVLSPVEDEFSPTPGLQMRKTYTLYDGTTRMKVDHDLINTNGAAETWAFRHIAQTLASGAGTEMGDGSQDLWVYWPKGISNNDGADGYWRRNAGKPAGATITTDIVPGVIGFEFAGLSSNGGVCTHTDDPWLAWVEQTTGMAIVVRCGYDENGVYPEYATDGKGQVVQLFAASGFLELEVASPQAEVAANNGEISFIAEWFATRAYGHVRAVNDVGLITDTLVVDASTGKVTGGYGVFYEGTAKLFIDGAATAAGEWAVSCTTAFALDETVTLSGAAGAELRLYDKNDALVGTLDTWGTPTAASRRQPVVSRSLNAAVRVAGRSLIVNAPEATRLVVTSLDGRAMVRRTSLSARSTHVDLSGLPAGSYVVSLLGSGYKHTQKVAIQ